MKSSISKSYFYKYLVFTAVYSLFTALATWPASIAGVIVNLESSGSENEYSIPDLIFDWNITTGWGDALIFGGAWYLAGLILLGFVYLFFRSSVATFITSASIQGILGFVYIVLMSFSTIGYW